MSRRLVLTVVSGVLLAGGLAGSALADTSSQSSDSRSHKVCVNLGGDSPYLPPGYCVAWDDGATPSLTPGG